MIICLWKDVLQHVSQGYSPICPAQLLSNRRIHNVGPPIIDLCWESCGAKLPQQSQKRSCCNYRLMHPPLIRTSTVPAAFQHLSVAWPHQKEHPVRMPAACLIEKIGANGPTLKIHFRQRGRVKKWRHSMMPCLAGHCNALDTQNTKFRNAVPHHMSWNVIGKWLRHFGSREFSMAFSAGPASQLPFPLQFLHLNQLRGTSWGALKIEGNLLRKSPAHLQTLIYMCVSIHADVLILT